MARRAGRPTKLVPEIAAQIIKDLRAGLPRCVAANRIGIDPATLLAWIKRGEEGKAEYHDFCVEVKKAMADAIARKIAQIELAGTPGKQVAERKTVTVTKGEGDKKTVTVTAIEKYSAAEWQALAWLLERMHRGIFGANRNEVRELRDQVRTLETELAVLGGRLPAEDPDAEARKKLGAMPVADLKKLADFMRALRNGEAVGVNGTGGHDRPESGGADGPDVGPDRGADRGRDGGAES